MRLPKQVVIAGHVIKVKYRRGVMPCWGTYDDTKRTIELQSGMDSSRKAEIFLHECIHAIEHIHVLNLSEKAIKILGVEIIAMLRNNRISLCKKSSKVTAKD